MAPGSAATGALFKFLRPGVRPQSTDIAAAAGWGVAAATTALWLVQVIFSSCSSLIASYFLRFRRATILFCVDFAAICFLYLRSDWK